ncbi:hypothetical protein FHN55_05235 [Streptomyces sp. NP160]|uniref:helix-turn-helix transcriptional regulator n=1 Tax=Streptomyces sp. NP160 TaxID=2586637 RepID=UPI001118363A|nr:LuxR family transcriptional regulator [Streptomyces sp. NP160]TNM69181.1 hypothetical protein FHN55_05235 [Streptomyces sp. NP160]
MLLGRGAQRQALTSALSRAATGQGASVLITGPPGSGLSALLEELAEAASSASADWLVLRARAARDESSLPHALLHQVLSPLLAELDGVLDEGRRSALEAAVGVRAPDEGRVPVAMAALGALEVLARHRPVLVAVDDAHWADPGSAAVLRFLARRLARTAVCLAQVLPDEQMAQPPAEAAAGRTGGAGTDEVVVVVVEPLGDADSFAVIDAERPDLDPLLRTAVAELSAGRPRRLVDLARLTEPLGAAAGPDALRRRLLRGSPHPSVAAARRALDGVPEDARRELAARGLLDDPAGAHLTALVARTGTAAGQQAGAHDRLSAGEPPAADLLLAAVAAEAAEEAETAELRAAWALRLEEAAPAAPPAAGRRMAAEALRQRVLADPAAAAGLAGPLEAAARSLLGVDAQRSGELFALAADLHLAADGGSGAAEPGSAGAAALHRAAEVALASGRTGRAHDLAARAAATDGGGARSSASSGAHERWRGLAALARGDRAAAVEHLQDALGHLAAAAATAQGPGVAGGEGDAGASGATEEVLATGTALVLVAGRRARPLAALDAALPVLPADVAARLRSVSRLALPWDRTGPAEQRRALDDALEVLSGAGLPVLRLAADAGRLLGRSQQVGSLCRSIAAAWPTTGPAAVDLHLALVAVSLDLTGVPEARHHVQQARAALRHAPEAAAAVGQAELLLERLGSGQVPDGALPDAVDLPESTERSGAVWCRAHAHRLRGDLAAAAAELLALWPPDGAPADAGALLNALPTVHALRESGADPAALARVVEQVTAWAAGSGAPLAVSSALASRATASEDPAEQRALLEEAVAAAGQGPAAAAPQLALGMLLRRSRHGVWAREPLGAALRIFEDHGSTAFAELARRELEATAPQRPPRPMGSAVLTGQERTVASLAAKGLANADIARSLGISARTVAHHLQHVYAKLGVPGRQHLRARLEDR